MDKPLLNERTPVCLMMSMDHYVYECCETVAFISTPPSTVIPQNARLTWIQKHQVCLKVFLQNLMVKHPYLLYTLGTLTLTRWHVLVDHLKVIPVNSDCWKSNRLIL